MQHIRSLGRVSLLAVSSLAVLSACAMATPPAKSGFTPVAAPHFQPTGVFGDYLAGQFALSQSQPTIAANEFLKALSAAPHSRTILQKAFFACAITGNPEAVPLARRLPDNQVAQLVLADHEARAGHWQAAEQRYRSLPRQGLTQLLQPLLVAWAQQGAGNTRAALATLHPLVQQGTFRGIYALHAALIADLGGQVKQAGQLYRQARADSPDMNLRLAQILASWQARTGHPAAAQHTLAELDNAAPELSITTPGLVGTDMRRPVQSATQGIAEAYLTLAGALRTQNSGPLAQLMVQLALDMRPDFAAARLVGAAILAQQQQDDAALHMLSGIPDSDPLAPLAELRRAVLDNSLGHKDAALQVLRRLAQVYGGNPMPLIMQGDVLREQKHFHQAIDAYTKAIDAIGTPAASDWGVFYNRGIAYDMSHDWPKAQADFKAALHLSPNEPAVLNYLGYTWANRDEHLKQARAMIEKALQQLPDDGAITDSLGWVMLRQGQTKAAVNELQRAVELDPENSTINGHLGDAYWAAGHKLEASYQWHRALTLNPTPDDVAKLEAKLRQQSPKATEISGQ